MNFMKYFRRSRDLWNRVGDAELDISVLQSDVRTLRADSRVSHVSILNIVNEKVKIMSDLSHLKGVINDFGPILDQAVRMIHDLQDALKASGVDSEGKQQEIDALTAQVSEFRSKLETAITPQAPSMGNIP